MSEQSAKEKAKNIFHGIWPATKGVASSAKAYTIYGASKIKQKAIEKSDSKKEIAKETAIATTCGVATAGIYTLLLKSMGFKSAGIAPKSFAAYWQSLIGNVAAKSVFAKLTSQGAKRTIIPLGSEISIFIITALGGLGCYYFFYKRPQYQK